jgi:hypothetical protein
VSFSAPDGSLPAGPTLAPRGGVAGFYAAGAIQRIAMQRDGCHPEALERASLSGYPQIKNNVVNAMKSFAVIRAAHRLCRVTSC